MAARELAITKFSLYSIGIILCKLGRAALFQEFLADGFERCGICHVRLGPDDLRQVVAAHTQHALDFDDAYQYVAAAKLDWDLVSFDSDFDVTPRGRKTPALALRS